MTSPLIRSVIYEVITELYSRDLIELAPGAKIRPIADTIAETMQGARVFAQFGPWLADALLASPLVDELFATNEDLLEILRDISP
ncbi:MAG: hypothetical protein ACI8S6_001467 [Myxococcota bacterium]|jgi:hypothetical protein